MDSSLAEAISERSGPPRTARTSPGAQHARLVARVAPAHERYRTPAAAARRDGTTRPGTPRREGIARRSRRCPRCTRRRAHAYAYLATAALPIYVLHQPVVVAVAYFVVGWSAPIPVEYAVIVTVSLAAYEFLVRHTRVTRVLYGMRG